MEIITYAQLNNDVLTNLYKIPRNVDLIVGIPRSGLLVANMLALYLNKPLTDVDGLLKGHIMSAGYTKEKKDLLLDFSKIDCVLVVDDSVNSGKSIINVRNLIQDKSIKLQVYYLAAYIRTGKEDLVDIFFRKVDDDRVFEWNYIHNKLLKNACFDIDGVLCYDPSNKENDDGSNYLKFIENAQPKLIPTRKIGYLVTSRLEKYREPTEKWLSDNNIQYGQLFMMPLETAEERRKLGNHGSFKAEIFGRLKDATWFIESEKSQAKIIAQMTGKSVLCVGESYAYSNRQLKNNIKIARKRVSVKTKKQIKRVLPEKLLNFYRKLRTK